MIRQWIHLLRLAHRRFHSDDDYCQFQVYQGRLILDYLIEQGVNIQNVKVLDLGCGRGGYGRVMADAGAEVVSIDLSQSEAPPPTFVLANALRLPFDSSCFNMVFCASLIEHVPDPAQLLAEIKRVLASDGAAYLSFPPFYSPVGGHQFKPYHLLGERWALRLYKHKVDSYATSCGKWGLYPLTIRRARQLFAEAGLKIKHESTRFLPFNVARLPWLGEFLTWHVQFVLSKGSDSSVWQRTKAAVRFVHDETVLAGKWVGTEVEFDDQEQALDCARASAYHHPASTTSESTFYA